jgi:RNA polymerase-binding transcription factor DksA
MTIQPRVPTARRANPTARPSAPVAALRASMLEEVDVLDAEIAEVDQTLLALEEQRDVDTALEREVLTVARRRALHAVADIQEALGRIDHGTYGRCERCGSEIELERLRALPTTRHCFSCPMSRSAAP